MTKNEKKERTGTGDREQPSLVVFVIFMISLFRHICKSQFSPVIGYLMLKDLKWGERANVGEVGRDLVGCVHGLRKTKH